MSLVTARAKINKNKPNVSQSAVFYYQHEEGL